MEYYKYLLYAATNLNRLDKQQTWINDLMKCGFNDWNDYEQYCSKLPKIGMKEKNVLRLLL